MSPAKPHKGKPFAIRLTVEARRELERRASEMALGPDIKALLFANGDNRRRRGPRSSVKEDAKLAEVLACLGQPRLGRSTLNLLTLLNDLQQPGIDLDIITQGIDTRTSIGRTVFDPLAVIAEFEREQISDAPKPA